MSDCTPIAFPKPRSPARAIWARRLAPSQEDSMAPPQEMGPSPKFLKGVMVGLALAVPIWVLVIALFLG